MTEWNKIMACAVLVICLPSMRSQNIVCKDDHCPEACICTFGYLSCIKDDLREVPKELPAQTFSLFLDHNHISHISAYSFYGCLGLEEISLRSNVIKSIDKLAFNGLPSLRYLDISYNSLTFDNTLFPPGTFDDLVYLKELYMDHNAWENMSAYRGDLIEPLSKLQTLHMDGIPSNTSLGDEFAKLTNLQNLEISGGLAILTKTFFAKLKNLDISHLSFFECKIKEIEEYSLVHFKYLLSLTFKNISSLNLLEISKSFVGLENSSILSIEVEACTNIFDGPFDLSENFFKPLANTSLQMLILRGNNVRKICKQCFSKYLPELQYLGIANDYWYGFGSLFDDLPFLQGLETLIIVPVAEYRQIESSIQDRDISSAMLTTTSPSPRSSYSVVNDILFVQVPVSLKVVAIRLTDLLTVLDTNTPSIYIQGECYLDSFLLSTSKYFLGVLVIEQPKTAIDFSLDMSRNNLQDLNSDFMKQSLKNGLKLTKLLLQANDLSSYFDAKGIFTDFYDLETLDISSNKIASLPNNAFNHMKKLQSLHLRDNKLTTIAFDITPLKLLVELDISFNTLTHLDIQITKDLDQISKERSFFLSISDNPLICSCDTLEFVIWLQHTPIKAEKDYLQCYFGVEKVDIFKKTGNIFDKLNKQCNSRIYIIATSISFSLFLVVLGILIFVYRHRWDVRFFLLKLVRNRKIYEDLHNQSDYDYDAFVVYDVEDRDWVQGELLEHLEQPGSQDSTNERCFTLCVHHRDFLPGTLIEENIIDSIQKSKKTIVVLSRNFVVSRWCDFELQIARTKSIEEGRDIIIVIMLEPVPAADMSSTLASLIKRVTYLEWPASHAGQAEFWTKLRESLTQRSTNRLVCSCGGTLNDDH